MLPCERQMLRHTTSWEELHRNVCDCICMTAHWPYSTHWLPSTHWLHTTLFTEFYTLTAFYTLTLHSTFFTVFYTLTAFYTLTLYLLYFYCISLFQASVALMFTDVNLVLLLYYFIIALSRFLNLKWALCLIKSKLQVDWLRGLPRVTPKVASNSHHCFSVCFLIQGQQLETFWFTRSLWCYITEHFTINYMNGQYTVFTKLFTINGQRNTKHFTKRNTKHFTINYINEILFLQY